MAHAIYITEAIVCGTRNSNTSDRGILLFTEQAGMVWATARSVREERSKQRYALQDFSRIRVSLVRGKGGWRIGSVEAIENPYWQAGAREARAGLRDVVSMLRRFLQGEEPNPVVYTDVQNVLKCLPHLEPATVPVVIEHFELRLLYNLGYIAPQTAFQPFLSAANWWKCPEPLPTEAVLAVEQAVSLSHL